MRKLILSLSSFFISVLCFAQNSDLVRSKDYNIDALIEQVHKGITNKRTEATEINIPVQVHVVVDKFGSLPDFERINADFLKVNEHFKNIGFNFFFCGPFNVINNAEYFSLEGLELNDMVSNYNLPGTVDIFYVGAIDNCSWCGITYLGFSMGDVILVKNDCIGTKTLAHELGHYFGLDHPHNEQWGLEFVDGTNCQTAGDKLCDTPAEPVLSGRVDAGCRYIGQETDPKGKPYNPNTNNIMSYTRSECATTFTPQQYALMLSVYENKVKAELNCQTKVDFTVAVDKKLIRLNRGQANTVPVYISNYSPASYNGPLEYVISMLDAVGRETVLTRSSFNKTWKPFQFDTIPLNVNIPANAAEGMYTLKAAVNPTGSIAESNNLNNTSEHRLGVYQAGVLLPDLELKVVANSDHDAGYQFSFTSKLTNVGKADLTGNYSRAIYISLDPVPSGDDIILRPTYGSMLKVGQTDSIQENVILPYNLDVPYYVILIADFDDYIKELNEQNNMQVVKVVSNKPAENKWKYDLKPTSIEGTFDTLRDTIDMNSSFWLDVDYVNNNPINWWELDEYPESDLRASYGALYLSRDTALDTGDILLARADGRLYRDNGWISFWMSLGANMELGWHYLVVQLDPDNYLLESNKANNTYARKIYIRKGFNPDLYIDGTPVLSTTKIDFGKPVTVQATIKNKGFGPSGSWQVRYNLSKDPYENYNDNYLSNYSSSFTLKENSSYQLYDSFVVDSAEVKEGEYYLVTCMSNSTGYEYTANNCVVNPELLVIGRNVSVITNLDENNESPSETIAVKLYPNPAFETVEITSSETMSQIDVLNEIGGLQYTSSVFSEQHKINIKDFPAGLYFVRIKNSVGSVTRKLLINK